ncbi:methylmalonyl-CoA mutase family protein [Luteibacter aegosomatis]|uniref:methylmalonyl-CoA mutase family protein n=1 Tax=Luteibacter aegosomatis TaxID=2911537 RepID=UPI001FF704B1|nr:methylmalonyl-CoA mutase family protein [Luteibacter aegosomatis]UPG87126.1 methylmalonyl-CoA mutase family protein [Luteibacter aegosomatis]
MSSQPKHIPASQSDAEATPLRFVTAASLFDGHDAAINIMRRIIQSQGAEVIHLGHNRSVEDVVRAALQEDADAIALSSYQGGHVEYFKYMVDMLRERGAGHVRVFGGGGGTITPEEIRELQAYGVERIYHPNDGMKLGLAEMIEDVMLRTRRAQQDRVALSLGTPSIDDEISIGAMLSAIEEDHLAAADLERLRKEWKLAGGKTPVLGLTGTGGAGKSSVVDELLLRFLHAFPRMRIAVLAVDPTRRRSGGALLGDRIRMNSLRSPRVYMRSMATRRQHAATSVVLHDCIDFLKAQSYDLVIVETAGIGQSDSEIVDLVDFPVYVMTSEYGAASQLEKIDMLDFAELVVLNKYDKRGAEDALRDVRKQWKRNRTAFSLTDEQVPVYPTIASQFNDPGVTWMFSNLCRLLREKLSLPGAAWTPEVDTALREPRATVLIPGSRVRYLAEIAEQGRGVNASIGKQAEAASKAQHYYESLKDIGDEALPRAFDLYDHALLNVDGDRSLSTLRQRYNESVRELTSEAINLLREWPARFESVTAEFNEYTVRDKTIRVENYRESLSHQKIRKVSPPKTKDWGELLSFLMRENLPGHYPYTGGVFPYRRAGEDPTRMFAGEGTPERTNRRFHYLSLGGGAARLSTAFDSVTLYGEDPAPRPDIYGKIGNSGVSIATLDDMKKLYSGFDLSAPSTSVSMTINGPAPIILAMFMNTAIDQNVEKYLNEDASRWEAVNARIAELYPDGNRPRYNGELPKGNDGLGLGLLGVSGEEVVDAETYARIKAYTLATVRGTVQADILKEDQAQNTCIFSTEFALRMMGDIQQYFVDHKVRNFYSVSISGYHIAEAGANPISQLAFTLSNGFTIVEYYLARGMKIDDFAPNLSFFFSNGMDPEYTVIGRVARRIWARAMRERYGASARSQMLKYHIQTSGRSLHAQEIQFNDIRTTLQALYALFDNCNSLHTNAYDEAITTPTEESVRRAVAIQLIINRELGLNFNENPWQGSFVVDELTDLVEEAVYKEFEAISERGGVLGAMDTMYQRGKIQEESMYYEQKKHDGSLPLIGVNTFLPKDHGGEIATEIELIRSTPEEKGQQIDNVKRYGAARNGLAPDSLRVLQNTARERRNVFEQLMEAVKNNSLGQISHALYDVGGEYRRNM